MFGFLKRLFGGAPAANPLLVGVWAPVEGNPKETIEYRADGTVRMAMFGGMAQMTGRYRFLDKDTIQIDWDNQPSPGADEALARLNEGLAAQGQGVQMRAVQQTVLRITVTDTELKTLHVEKGRQGHFRRVGSAPAAQPAQAQPPTKIVARSILLGQMVEPRDVMHQMARVAGESVIATAKEDHQDLDFSPKTLVMVDQILVGFNREGHNEDTIPTAILGFGWYVGETIVRNEGGRWRVLSDVTPPGEGCAALVVELPSGTICDPIGQALRLVKNGINDSVAFFYATIATK